MTIVKMPYWHYDKWAKCQVVKMQNGQSFMTANVKLAKCHVDKIPSGCRLVKMSSGLIIKVENGRMAKCPVTQCQVNKMPI